MQDGNLAVVVVGGIIGNLARSDLSSAVSKIKNKNKKNNYVSRMPKHTFH